MNRAINRIELKLFQGLISLTRYPLISHIARAVSRTGDGWLYMLILPLSIYQFRPDMVSELVILAIVGFGLERLLYFVLKNLFKRLRPHEALRNFHAFITPSDRFSMPSGHTSAAFFVATFLTVGISIAFLPLYLWAVCVGLSRMLLGVHFPTDLLAGASLGASVALMVL